MSTLKSSLQWVQLTRLTHSCQLHQTCVMKAKVSTLSLRLGVAICPHKAMCSTLADEEWTRTEGYMSTIHLLGPSVSCWPLRAGRELVEREFVKNSNTLILVPLLPASMTTVKTLRVMLLKAAPLRTCGRAASSLAGRAAEAPVMRVTAPSSKASVYMPIDSLAVILTIER